MEISSNNPGIKLSKKDGSYRIKFSDTQNVDDKHTWKKIVLKINSWKEKWCKHIYKFQKKFQAQQMTSVVAKSNENAIESPITYKKKHLKLML